MPIEEAPQGETERVRTFYERNAESYDKGMAFAERILFRGGRAWACSQAVGDVLEIAVGTGRNLPYYPVDVTLTGIDLSQAMLEQAHKRAEELGRAVTFLEADAQSLPFPDNHFDTVVSTLTLCTIPDERRAVQEVWRVLRPGGRFVAMEHVRSPHLLVRGIERLLDPLSVRFEADHLLREPVEAAQAEGFTTERIERSRLGFVERLAARKE